MKATLPIKILFIEDDGCHLLIAASINGKAATLLVDTGASKTVFDKNKILNFVDESALGGRIVDKLSTGLGTSDMETHAVLLKQLKLGTLLIHDFQAILLDLTHVNISYEKLDLPAIDGVLGSDLMMEYQAVVDYKNRELKLQWKKRV